MAVEGGGRELKPCDNGCSDVGEQNAHVAEGGCGAGDRPFGEILPPVCDEEESNDDAKDPDNRMFAALGKQRGFAADA